MKNLKKVLALVVVFSMMLGTVAFAAFPDVAEDADYANAVNTLAALDIIGGDDQGNFNPDNTITRAEFTKIVCEMQGIKGDAGKGATIFTDVAADHWASGYINMAVGMGIINGMGDGTFAPSAPVTYEQAIKMITVALGYEPMAADNGGYPTGYLAAAQAAGVTKGIKAPAQTDAAVRSLVAELVYNALDVPMMQQTGFGSEKTFEIMDGTKEKDRVTLLTSKFEVVKLAGVVTANDKVDMVNGNDLTEGKINFRIFNNYKTEEKAFKFADADVTAGYKDVAGIEAEGTLAEELIGAKATIFVQENNNRWEVIAAVADAAANSVEIALNAIDTTSGRTEINALGKKTIAYYVEGANNSVKLSIVDSPIILWNDVAGKTLANVVGAAAQAGTVVLTDWNDDDKFDAISVEQYKHYVVEDINEATLRINKRFRLDAEEMEYDVTIKDVDGNDVAFEDIKLGDVIAVKSDSTNINAPWNARKYIDVVVLGESVVEGVISAWDPNNASGAKAKIGDATYTVSSDYSGNTLDVTVEGAFYLDINGNIFAFDGTKTSSGNLGIILKAAVVASGVDADIAQIKMLTKDGEVVVYNIAETVKIRNAADSLISFKRTANITADNFATGFAGGTVDADGATDSDATDNVTIGDYLAELFGTEATKGAGIASRVVQFKANANGEITEITPQGVTGRYTVTDLGSVAYNANTLKLGTGRFDEGTILFSLNDNLAKSKIIGTDALIDDANYSAIIVTENNVKEAAAAIIYAGGNSLGDAVEGMAVVTSVAKTTDEDGDDAYVLTVVTNGVDEEIDVLVTKDTSLADEFSAAYSQDAITMAAAMNIGSVLLYTADEAGNATVIAPIAYVSNDNFARFGTLAFNGTEYGTANKTKFYAGISNADFDKNEVYVTGGYTIESETNTNEYRVNNANSRKVTIDVGSYAGGNVIDPEGGMGNAFLARYVDDECVDIIAIDNRIAYIAGVAENAISLATFGASANEVRPAIDVDKTGNATYEIVLTAESIDVHQDEAPSAAKWIGFKITSPANTTKAVGEFGGVAFTDTDCASANDGFIAFYVDAENPKDTLTFTFYNGNTPLTAEMTFSIDAEIIPAPAA